MLAHEVTVGHHDPGEWLAQRPEGPPAPLLSPSTAAALSRTLDTLRDGYVLERHLRGLAGMVSEDAHRAGLRAEQMLVALKREWDAMPDAQPASDRDACVDLRRRLITLCIDEFYAGRRAT